MSIELTKDEPFPLKRYFWRRVAPGLLVFLGLLVATSVYIVTRMTESIYLEQARQRAETVAHSVAANEERAWAHLLAQKDTPEDDLQLRRAIEKEVHELRIEAMMIYDLAGRVLYSSNPQDYGTREQNPALRKVVFDGVPGLVRTEKKGQPLYEMYVPLHDDKGELVAVFEIYAPVGYLDKEIFRAGFSVAAVTATLLVLHVAALGLLVARGQREIDARGSALRDVKRQLETFVSKSAVDAARGGGDIPSKRIRLTLFYSDVRDFTGYSENNPPERVVWFLNELMGIQLAAIRAHGGDVDKMIGDALLARFQGEDAEASAIAAAIDVQAELDRAELPRAVGIGVHAGEVISGAIGAAERRDFTVIGDGVNVTARLCSAAAGGEIVVESETLKAAAKALGQTSSSFGAAEEITVKGRREPVIAHRRATNNVEK